MADYVTMEQPGDGVALVTMSNPAINNHGSWAGIGELAEAMREAREGGARVTVLASGVPGHWFEHAWLQDLADAMEGKPTTGPGAAWFRAVGEITHTDVVSIAAISGDCSGGGAELGWACDLRIAEEQARFGQPEVQIGVATGLGGASRLTRLIGRTATAEMVLLGRPMTARRIYELGGVNRVVPEGQAIAVALDWARELASRSHGSLATLKRMLNEADDLPMTEALRNEQRLFGERASTPQAIGMMRDIQSRFDGGASIESVYGGPKE